jgi:hypothetical protein
MVSNATEAAAMVDWNRRRDTIDALPPALPPPPSRALAAVHVSK